LDTSELLNKDDQKTHQSSIRAPQWAIQISRFDIQTTVMTLSRFRVMPRQGHLDHVKRICGRLSKMRHATIKIRTDTPDCSDIPVKMHDWGCSCCADAKEEIPLDAPKPNGKPATMTKVTAQGKGQKNNHSLIEGSEKGTISPVIQAANQNRVPSSGPRTSVLPKGKDARFNSKRKVERK